MDDIEERLRVLAIETKEEIRNEDRKLEKKIILGDGVRRTVTAEMAETHLSVPLKTAMINVSHLSSLGLRNMSLTPAAAEMLVAGLRGLAGLCVINFADVLAGQEREQALKVLKILCAELSRHPLTEVDFSDNALGVAGITMLGSILKEKKLRGLYLNNTGLSSEAAKVLLDCLGDSLQVLELNRNMLGDDGIKQIALLLTSCAFIRHVSLSSCRFSMTGVGGDVAGTFE